MCLQNPFQDKKEPSLQGPQIKEQSSAEGAKHPLIGGFRYQYTQVQRRCQQLLHVSTR